MAPSGAPAFKNRKKADLAQEDVKNLQQLLPGMGESLPQVTEQPSKVGK